MRFSKSFFGSVLALFLAACSEGYNKDVTNESLGRQGANDAYGNTEYYSEIDGRYGSTKSLDSRTFVPDRVFFDLDKSTVDSRYKKDLDAQADFIRSNDIKRVVIGGYCDERGGIEYNYALGERRANYVKKELVKRGVRVPIKVVSYGKEVELVSGRNEDAWKQNRAAVLTLE